MPRDPVPPGSPCCGTNSIRARGRCSCLRYDTAYSSGRYAPASMEKRSDQWPQASRPWCCDTLRSFAGNSVQHDREHPGNPYHGRSSSWTVIPHICRWNGIERRLHRRARPSARKMHDQTWPAPNPMYCGIAHRSADRIVLRGPVPPDSPYYDRNNNPTTARYRFPLNGIPCTTTRRVHRSMGKRSG